jgi:transposase
MVMNGLGFHNRALYLTPEFFDNLPVGLLLGEDITAADLNDDSLGTALDELVEAGITETFYNVSSKVLKAEGITYQYAHLDSTTFSLHGDYDMVSEDPREVSVVQGYSKDNAPELNQVVSQMICASKSTIPVWLEVLSGNSSDKKSFPRTVAKFREQFSKETMPIMVADSALFSKDGIKQLQDTRWVTRVPETVAMAQALIQGTARSSLIDLGDGYHGHEISLTWEDIPQRWVLVHSEKAAERELATLDRRLVKEDELQDKAVRKLQKEEFACEADAQKAAEKFNQGLKYHDITWTVATEDHYATKGRPAKDAAPARQSYRLEASLVRNQEIIAGEQAKKGHFIVATNVLDAAAMPIKELVGIYKAQGSAVERGFRFLKDPLFYAESLYLNSPRRIMALIMVMTLSLLVYSLCERKIRDGLKSLGKTISSQVKKPTDNPTFRWVIQKFLYTTMVKIEMEDGSTISYVQLSEDQETVLEALGKAYQKSYFIEK